MHRRSHRSAPGSCCQHAALGRPKEGEIEKMRLGLILNVRYLLQIITTLDGEVVEKFPAKTSWMSMETVPKKQVVLLLTNLQIEVAYFYNNHAFTIKLPSHLFANKTEGLCGILIF
jgi:hypothetical protein